MCSPNYKGSGVHWDNVLLAIINCLGTLIGGPFILAAIVRAVAHVNALTVMSTNNAPGEPPSIVDVKDQRLSFLLVSVVLGCSVFLSSVFKLVPLAAMFGVFLYMGITSIESIQMFNRIWLFFTPVKHHPHVSYVRKASKLFFVKCCNLLLFNDFDLILGSNMEDACVYFCANNWFGNFVYC